MNVRRLNDAEIARLDAERSWLDAHVENFGAGRMLTRTAHDIATIQALLDVQPFSTGDPASLEVLGAAFGDVIAETMGFEWVVVSDEHGSDFALKHPAKMILAFPRDMIVKRVESGEVIDMTRLFQGVVAALKEQIAADGNASGI